MRVNVICPKGLKKHFLDELAYYRVELKKGNLVGVWFHLERAHVLGQSYPFEHSKVHYLMLQLGLKARNPKEVFGQLIRLIFGGWKSFIDRVPIGNTGGANVAALARFPISSDLDYVLKKYNRG